MNTQTEKSSVQKDKIILVSILYGVAAAIVLLGAAFCVYSAIFHVTFPVLTTQVSGVVFGLVVAFLGVRYLFSLQKLKAEVYKTTTAFSWDNFGKQKKDHA